MKQEESRRLAGGRGNGGVEPRTRVHSYSSIPRRGPFASGSDAAGAHGVEVPTMGGGKLLYTISEAAELLSLSRAHLYRLLQRGELASVSSGRSRRISDAALKGYVARLEQETQS